MTGYRRSFTLYPLFQIPFFLLCLCILLAGLFWLGGIGRPPVAVAIAIDLSSSTYEGTWNAPGSIMNREVQAIEAYLAQNNSGILRQPNQVKILGFATGVTDLNTSFQEDGVQTKSELNQTMSKNLSLEIGGGTNLDLAIQRGNQLLAAIDERCRELLLVTDGVASVSNSVIADTVLQRVRISAIVLGEAEASEIKLATQTTGGIYLSAPDSSNLEQLFTERFFSHLNNNWRWLLLWGGLAWIALMWTLIMPIDRWLLQGLFKLPFNFSGRLALYNALFWTAATPGIVYQIYRLFNLALPFTSQC